MTTAATKTTFALVMICALWSIPSLANDDDCKDIFDDAPAVSSKVEFTVNYDIKPPFRSKELWALETEHYVVDERIKEYRWRLYEKKRPAFWYLMDDWEESAPYLLKGEERAKYEQAVDELKQKRDDLENEISAQKRADRPGLLATADAYIKAQETSATIEERLLYARVMALPRERTVAVLSGNPYDKPSEEQVAKISEIVAELVNRGKIVIYDADSLMAPAIAEHAGPQGVGISAKALPNVYFRLRAFEHAHESIMTTDSMVALSLRLQNNGTFVLTEDNDSVTRLRKWIRDLDDKKINLGARIGSIAMSSSPRSILNGVRGEKKEPIFAPSKGPVKFPPNILPSYLPYDELEWILTYTGEMTGGQKELAKTGGAAMFGAGRMSEFTDLIYKTARKLAQMGVAIVTGGAGGAMRVANTAAWDAGGESVGIPIGGRNQLDTESKVHTEVQSKTFVSSHYETRIPLLLKNKGLIVLAPGGDGTLKELATTFLQYASAPESKEIVILLGKNYYEGLYEYIQGLPIPAQVKARVFLAEGAKNVVEIVNQEIQKGTLDPALLIQHPDPKPRNTNNKFPKEDPKGKDKDKDKDKDDKGNKGGSP